MFVAMNRFSVNSERAADFEHAWRTRPSYLDGLPGFVQFALLKGDNDEYISHTTWESRADFESWTRSEAFRRAHENPIADGILASHPRASFYEALIVEAGKPEVDGSTPGD
ncbi:MAG: antibiotic biosynthesis monooxygenase [Dehalococcoidia bacterium]|nr:antibiotic biosynthesis monooxygenase [Dehalococcoidia bacterium]